MTRKPNQSMPIRRAHDPGLGPELAERAANRFTAYGFTFDDKTISFQASLVVVSSG